MGNNERAVMGTSESGQEVLGFVNPVTGSFKLWRESTKKADIDEFIDTFDLSSIMITKRRLCINA